MEFDCRDLTIVNFLTFQTLANGAILNLTESKLIFGNIPDLLRIHESLLNELQIVIDELTIGKNRSLGKCFLNHTQREQFGKTYRKGSTHSMVSILNIKKSIVIIRA